MIRRLEVLIYRLKRIYQWIRYCLWNTVDFDSHSLFPVLEYALKRLESSLKNGFAIHEPKDLKALRISIKLANRVSNNYHSEKLWSRHDRKWGKAEYWFSPTDDTRYSTFHSQRPKAILMKDQVAERKAMRLIMEREYEWEKRDIKLLFAIIQNHWKSWWD